MNSPSAQHSDSRFIQWLGPSLPELTRPENLQLIPVRFSDHLHFDLIEKRFAGQWVIVIKNDPVIFLF